MPMPIWKLNKEIPFSASYTARFYTLYEDARDIMCDDPRPDWTISRREKNRKVEVVDNIRRTTIYTENVSKEDGNAMYREMAPLDNHGYGKLACNDWLVAHGVGIEALA